MLTHIDTFIQTDPQKHTHTDTQTQIYRHTHVHTDTHTLDLQGEGHANVRSGNRKASGPHLSVGLFSKLSLTQSTTV